MPKISPSYPAEFPRQMLELVRAGRTPENLSETGAGPSRLLITTPIEDTFLGDLLVRGVAATRA